MIITLTDKELYFLRELALKRNGKEKKFGACTYGGKQGSGMAHFIGLTGEYAVAKSVGTQVDERIFEDHGDDGIDIESGKWGVKTTTKIWDIMGWKPKDIIYQPDKPVGIRNRVADCTKAKQELGWYPTVSFIDGLRETIDWYVSTHDRDDADESSHIN